MTVSTGDGFDYFYSVDGIFARETTLTLTGKQRCETEPKINLTLFSSVLKGDKNDTVVRMCTELGVQKFCPFISEFTVAAKESYKTGRLQKIAQEAAKQSGRGRVPEVCEPKGFDEMLHALSSYDLAVFPYERAVDVDIKTFLRKNIRQPVGRGFAPAAAKSDTGIRQPVGVAVPGDLLTPLYFVAVIVGGEGGFSENEALKLTNLSTMPVIPLTLGKRILRADTACAAICAMILYEAGEMA